MPSFKGAKNGAKSRNRAMRRSNPQVAIVQAEVSANKPGATSNRALPKLRAQQETPDLKTLMDSLTVAPVNHKHLDGHCNNPVDKSFEFITKNIHHLSYMRAASKGKERDLKLKTPEAQSLNGNINGVIILKNLIATAVKGPFLNNLDPLNLFLRDLALCQLSSDPVMQEMYCLSLLLWGARMGYDELVSISLKVGADPNGKLSLPNSDLVIMPLCEAVAHGHVNIVKLLLENFADPDLQDLEGKAPLHHAIYSINAFRSQAKGDSNTMKTLREAVTIETTEEIINLLLSESADIDILDSKRYTPLHLATLKSALSPPTSSSIVKIKLLLKHGADPDIPNYLGDTPLHTLLNMTGVNRYPPEKIIEILAKSNLDIDFKDRTGMTALHKAVKWSLRGAVQILIENGADPNAEDDYRTRPIHLVRLTTGDPTPIYKLLLGAGGDINALEYTQVSILREAVARRVPEVFKFLMENGADFRHLDKDGSDILHLVFTHLEDNKGSDPDFEVVANLLIEKLDNPETDGMDVIGNTALHRAVKLGSSSTVQLLLQKGANTEAQNKDGRTVLHDAVDPGSCWVKTEQAVSIVKLLLDYGARINARDFKGQTPLNKAKLSGCSELIDILMSKGAYIENSDGMKRSEWLVNMEEILKRARGLTLSTAISR